MYRLSHSTHVMRRWFGESHRRRTQMGTTIGRATLGIMLTGIDHLVIAVRDLDDAAAELEARVGLAAAGGGRHPALGTENRLAWLGDSYVELISVVDAELAEGSWLGAPTLAALQRGGGLATWAIATDSIEADVAALRANGAGYSDPVDGARERPDGRLVRWRLATGRHVGPTEPFLIEHDADSAEWTAQDRAARSAERHPVGGPVRLESLELPVERVTAAIQALARTADLRFRPSLAGRGARDAGLGRQVVRLSPIARARGPAATPTIGLASPAGNGQAVEALGCHWTIKPSA
jgi:hypothetical protein